MTQKHIYVQKMQQIGGIYVWYLSTILSLSTLIHYITLHRVPFIQSLAKKKKKENQGKS